MNVLILVLSAQREPWGALMKCSQETWDAENHPQTRTLYYCGKSDQPCTDKVFYSPTLTESLEDVSPRTMEAFELALTIPDWDYLARPNSSCYVHKRNLVSFCGQLPKENVIRGILTGGGEQSFMWGGCQYVFSRDVIERMVAAKDKWDHKLMDDVSITRLAQEIGIPMESKGWCASINMAKDGSYIMMTYGHAQNFTFTDFEDANKAEGHFFFRCKQDFDRTQDLRIFRELKAHLK